LQSNSVLNFKIGQKYCTIIWFSDKAYFRLDGHLSVAELADKISEKISEITVDTLELVLSNFELRLDQLLNPVQEVILKMLLHKQISQVSTFRKSLVFAIMTSVAKVIQFQNGVQPTRAPCIKQKVQLCLQELL